MNQNVRTPFTIFSVIAIYQINALQNRVEEKVYINQSITDFVSNVPDLSARTDFFIADFKTSTRKNSS